MFLNFQETRTSNQTISPAEKSDSKAFLDKLLPNANVLLTDGYERCGKCGDCLVDDCQECKACCNGNEKACIKKTCIFGELKVRIFLLFKYFKLIF